MKGAHLWKRILNEGFVSDGTPSEMVDRILAMIMKSTIIVDTRDLPPQTQPGDIESFSGVAIPFQTFWLEGTKLVSVPFGTLVKSEQLGQLNNVHCVCILDFPQNPPEVIGGISFDLLQDGRVTNIETLVSPNMAARNDGKKMGKLLYACAFAVCDTLTMLSCKNVDLKPNDNDPKQVRRAIKRHGGTPDSYRYHTLVVRPAGSKPGTPGQDIGIMPRHVCRGHFSEYGPEFGKGLLFGKYAGRFYVPPHMKGDKKNGIVEKDYAIPQQQ